MDRTLMSFVALYSLGSLSLALRRLEFGASGITLQETFGAIVAIHSKHDTSSFSSEI